jgi:D-amino-acid dehydrogenase
LSVSDITCDIAVVGGGLVGTALAYELVTAGADIVLLDSHHPGRATDAGAGILSPETTWNPDAGWISFGLAAASHYRTLIARLAEEGAPDTGYAQCGLLLVASEPGEDDWFATQADQAMARSPGVVCEVTPPQATDLFPPLGPVRRALHNPAAARIDGRLITAALLEAALRRGLRRLDATATSLRLSGDRLLGVDSDAGTVSCGAVAVAGGAWSPTFGEQLGITIPVQPVKGQIVHLQLPDPGDGGGPDDTGRWPIVSPVLNHYLVAWPGGRVACGGTYEPDALFDNRPTVAGLAELLHGCLALAPGLAQATVVEVRVGLRPVSPDGSPVLGPVPGCDDVHLVTGHGTEGLLLGPHSAALVARCLLGEPVPDELRPFGVARFMH